MIMHTNSAEPVILQVPPVERREWRVSHDALIVSATFLIMTIMAFIGEKIPVSDGLGWDGIWYGKAVIEFESEVFGEAPLDRYHGERVLPSAVLHYTFRALGIKPTTQDAIRSFCVINILCGTLVAWLWCRVARQLSLSVGGKWLGFVGFSLSFAVSKHPSFYPVLTDLPAYALAMGMLSCYLNRQFWGLLLLTGLGMFTWPTLFIPAVLMLLFPRGEGQPAAAVRPNMYGHLLAGFATYYYVLMLGWTLMHVPAPLNGFLEPLRNFAGLSMLVAGAYVYFLALEMSLVFPWTRQQKISSESTSWSWSLFRQRIAILLRDHGLRILIVIAFIGGVRLLQNSMAPRPGLVSPQYYLLLICLESIARPGVFVVAHIMYFGPLVIVGMFCWPRVAQHIREAGLGLSLGVTLVLVQGLDSESRHLIYAVPLVMPFVIQATEGRGWTRRQYGLLLGLALFTSKMWMTFDKDPALGNAAFTYPQQFYMMNYGPYMGIDAYLVQFALVVGMVGLIYANCFYAQTAEMPSSISLSPMGSRRRMN